ncbi:hypothetical protein EV200_104298 [Pedobacter psychrotolerans]|uniref:Beta-lactamase superfamily II metal-dependent hydrolase n=1 Tax=Pedobacter psychrotolerans TaxID=1843235 RepID=A0A4R2HD64_9SPHI|nr:hypothetical protein [Pedobacter psychrotolerans]TCO25261.1 hypothetical protein EV200_104298 [Pedobacter psychrotolerans]GGE46881.1 hypothetical protein GCM10011413_11210 [Pedobacter psychrotolerans]
MKTTRRVLNTFILLVSTFVSLHAQKLEIHQLNVDQADAAVVLTRKNDTISKIMIIDFGEDHTSELVGSYIQHVLKYTGDIDYAIVSHYDSDHYGGFNSFTKKYLLALGKKVKCLIVPGGFGPSIQYPDAGLTAGASDWNPNLKPEHTATATLKDFVTLISNPTYVQTVFQISEIKSISKSIDFDTIDNIPVTLDLVAGLQYVRGNTRRIISPKHSTNNDDGLAWVLHFGQFRFYTGGDLGGGTGNYTDHETPLATYFSSNPSYNAISLATKDSLYKGHICVAKLNHHGSKESSNDTFLSVTNPSLWLISCGQQRGFNHPNVETLERMAKAPKPINEAKLRGICITTIPYNEDTIKVTKRFADTNLYWLAFSQAQMHKQSTPFPIGTYVVTVDLKNEIQLTDVAFKETPITEQSVFSVEFHDPKKPEEKIYQVFNCHHIK